MRFRLLNLLMVASLLMLGLKVADIVDRRQSLWEGLVSESAVARSAPKEEEKEKPSSDEHEKKEDDHDNKDSEGEATSEGEEAASEEDASEDAADTLHMDDENNFTQIELDILQRLGERRSKLEEWQKDLEVKENVLNITQTKIDQKIKELRELKTNVEAILQEYHKKEDEKTLTLVKIYENMKPKAAAKIFTELDIVTLLQVVEKMKEKTVAAILAEMDPKLAKDLTETFAAYGRLPDSGNEESGVKNTPPPPAAKQVAPVPAPTPAGTEATPKPELAENPPSEL